MAYTLEGGSVRWFHFLLKGVDPATFEALSPRFARDAQAVWVCQKRFAEGDPASLRVLLDAPDRTTAWAADDHHVYRTNLPRIEKKLDARTLVALDDAWAADATTVWSFDAERAVRGADRERFTILGHGYAQDGRRAFHRGEPVAHADVSSFRVLGPGYAADRLRVYMGPHEVPGLQPSRVRVLGLNYLLHEGDVLHGGSAVAGADAGTFKVLGRWFAKDVHRVYHGGIPVPEADAASFVEEPGLLPAGRDALARYVWNDRAGLVRAPASRRRPASVEGVLASWWSALEAHAFPVLDTTFNTAPFHGLDVVWNRARVVPSETMVRLEGGRLVVERAGQRAEGSVAGFLHPLATAWAAARGRVLDGVPCIRLLDERGFLAARGDLVRRRLLEVCFAETMELFDAVVDGSDLPQAELAMLLDLVERRARFVPTLAPHVVRRRVQAGWPKRPEVTVSATTNLAAIKRLVTHPFVVSPDPAERLAAAEFLHARLVDLDDRKGRSLGPLLDAWDPWLDDDSPRVREVAWEALDLTVQVLFEMDDPQRDACLLPLRRLVARGVNLDLNLARLWECAQATGRGDEAEQAWARLTRLIGDPRHAAAPHYFGDRPTPTFAAWREAAERRLRR